MFLTFTPRPVYVRVSLFLSGSYDRALGPAIAEFASSDGVAVPRYRKESGHAVSASPSERNMVQNIEIQRAAKS